MINSTNSSEYIWAYEYYYDYLDPVPVDASKLKYNRCKFCLLYDIGNGIICFTICQAYQQECNIWISFFTDSIVIIMWIVLAAFIGTFFFVLSYMQYDNLPRCVLIFFLLF